MATRKPTGKKKLVTSKSRKITKNSSQKVKLASSNWSLQSPRALIFISLFAVVGIIALVRSFARNDLPSEPDALVAAYIVTKPISVSRDVNTGSTTYNSYPGSYYLLVDGTLVCDDGTSDTVRQDTLKKGEVTKLHNELKQLNFEALPNEIATTTASVSNEGFLIGSSAGAKGTVVYTGAEKPEAFNQAKTKLLAKCNEVTKKENRTNRRIYKQPKLTSSKSGLSETFSALFTNKVFASSSGGTQGHDQSDEDVQYYKINEHRGGHGVQNMARSYCLANIARNWAVEMARAGYIYHNPNLKPQVDAQCNTGWSIIGENVGTVGSADSDSSSSVFNAFIASPAHHANIDDARFNQNGVGVYVDKGTNKTWIVQVFGNCTNCTPEWTTQPNRVGEISLESRFPTPVAYITKTFTSL